MIIAVREAWNGYDVTAGVRALYAVPEEQASFGLATFELVLKRKIPFELAAGRRTLPHDLFKNPDVETYLGHLERAVTLEIDELGDRGTFEAFAEAKRLGYRLGLASWAGEEAASPRYLAPLISAFERLDASDSFVRPLGTVWTMATKKRGEWKAMREIEAIVSAILRARRASGRRPADYLDQIEEAFGDLPVAERDIQVARDLMIIQMGAQSNLFAALAWTLVNLLLHPDVLARVQAGDDGLLERAAHESIRLAQRSLTLRHVLSPLDVGTETGTYTLAPGVFLAPLLSVNNPCAAPGLDRAVARVAGQLAQQLLGTAAEDPGEWEHLGWSALVPGATLLDLGDPDRHPPAARALRSDAALPKRASAGAADRWRGAGRPAVHRRVRCTAGLTSAIYRSARLTGCTSTGRRRTPARARDPCSRP